MKTCSAVADLERLDGTMTETDVDKAEVLNTFFTSVFTLESLENIPTFENRLHNTELTDFLITNEEVEKILKTLMTTKPPGPDGLHPRLLVELTDELVEPFQKIFTRSLAEGNLPQNWKEGNITPIFKKPARWWRNWLETKWWRTWQETTYCQIFSMASCMLMHYTATWGPW